jgi:hypothetical protein
LTHAKILDTILWSQVFKIKSKKVINHIYFNNWTVFILIFKRATRSFFSFRFITSHMTNAEMHFQAPSAAVDKQLTLPMWASKIFPQGRIRWWPTRSELQKLNTLPTSHQSNQLLITRMMNKVQTTWQVKQKKLEASEQRLGH